MGKALTPEERVARAKLNGYEPGAHTAEDSIRNKDASLDSTKEVQEGALKIWREYVLFISPRVIADHSL